MSPSSAKLRDRVVNAAIGVISSLFVLFGTGAYNRKEDVSAHALDLAAIRAKEATDVQQVADQMDRVLDLLCAPQPNAPACTSRPTRNSPGDILTRRGP